MVLYSYRLQPYVIEERGLSVNLSSSEKMTKEDTYKSQEDTIFGMMVGIECLIFIKKDGSWQIFMGGVHNLCWGIRY